MNYRLGALGCLDLSSLSTAEDPIDDNLYLRDLVMALRWVRENIAVFGGDPDNVTIFGESAGAHAVATLLAVPAAKGLFSQAIAESPAAGMVRIPGIAADTRTKLAELLGAGRGRVPALMAARLGGTGQSLRPPDRRGPARHARRVRGRPHLRHRLSAGGTGRGDAPPATPTACR